MTNCQAELTLGWKDQGGLLKNEKGEFCIRTQKPWFNGKQKKKRDFFPVEVAQSCRGFSLFNDRGGRLRVGEYRAMTEGACELVLNRERWEEEEGEGGGRRCVILSPGRREEATHFLSLCLFCWPPPLCLPSHPLALKESWTSTGLAGEWSPDVTCPHTHTQTHCKQCD